MAGDLKSSTNELRVRHADGSWRWMESIVVDARGDPAISGFIVTKRDITERRRMASALQASEARLRRIVTRAPIIVCAIDQEGIFTLSEGGALPLLGLREGDAVGHNIFVRYAARPDFRALARRALAGETLTTEIELLGAVFEAWWYSGPRKLDHGREKDKLD